MTERDEIPIDDLMLAELADDQASYLSRGRPLKSLSDEELQQAWMRAVTDLLDHQSGENHLALADPDGELAFRGLRPDYPAVETRLKEFAASLREGDPEIAAAIGRVIAKYQQQNNRD